MSVAIQTRKFQDGFTGSTSRCPISENVQYFQHYRPDKSSSYQVICKDYIYFKNVYWNVFLSMFHIWCRIDAKSLLCGANFQILFVIFWLFRNSFLRICLWNKLDRPLLCRQKMRLKWSSQREWKTFLANLLEYLYRIIIRTMLWFSVEHFPLECQLKARFLKARKS